MALLDLGQFRQPRRLVHRISDHRVLEPGVRTDVARNGPSRRDADTEFGLPEHRNEFVMQFAGGGQCGAGRVRVLDGCAEDAQRGVALELVDEAAVFLHRVDHNPEEVVEHGDDLAGRPGGGQFGGTDQIDEQHGHITFLAAEFGAALECSAGDILSDIAAEKIAHPLPLAEFANHVVEAGL